MIILVSTEKRLTKRRVVRVYLSFTRSLVPQINTAKTKFIALNIPDDVKLDLDGKLLERVDDFQYLGSYVASTEKDLELRKGKAWALFWKLSTIWNFSASPCIKLKLFNSSVLSILLYGCETWVLTPN